MGAPWVFTDWVVIHQRFILLQAFSNNNALMFSTKRKCSVNLSTSHRQRQLSPSQVEALSSTKAPAADNVQVQVAFDLHRTSFPVGKRIENSSRHAMWGEVRLQHRKKMTSMLEDIKSKQRRAFLGEGFTFCRKQRHSRWNFKPNAEISAENRSNHDLCRWEFAAENSDWHLGQTKNFISSH